MRKYTDMFTQKCNKLVVENKLTLGETKLSTNTFQWIFHGIGVTYFGGWAPRVRTRIAKPLLVSSSLTGCPIHAALRH